MNNSIKLLDCSLRDGGYVNDWIWGFDSARSIIQLLCKAGIDIVEVGFLRNTEGYNPDITVCETIEELNRLLPANPIGRTMYSAMAMRSNYDISKLQPYSGKGIEMIRITAHDYDIEEGMEFAARIKSLGYKLSINPINIMGYTDAQILWIIDQVNKIRPYQFAIVDTFGSMKRRDLERIVSIVDHNLDMDIRLALHLHENMSLGCTLAQQFIDMHLNRSITIDGSLMGVGRNPGNLPIELIADYLNDYEGKNYDIDYLMDAAQEYIYPMKGESAWGYNPAYFLSARYSLHRNYAEHYLGKGDLTNRDINHLLSRFDVDKKSAFDAEYADTIYKDYKDNRIDDSKDIESLKGLISGRDILILAPGTTIRSHHDEILEFIRSNNPIVISLECAPSAYTIDFAFFSNNKRFANADIKGSTNIIVTSNISGPYTFRFDYNSLSRAFSQGCNSFIMILSLLKRLGINKVYAAGADGYSQDKENYYKKSMTSTVKHGTNFNKSVSEAIRKVGMDVAFVTPTEYKV